MLPKGSLGFRVLTVFVLDPSKPHLLDLHDLDWIIASFPLRFSCSYSVRNAALQPPPTAKLGSHAT